MTTLPPRLPAAAPRTVRSLLRWPAAAGLLGLALSVAASTAYWQYRSTFAIPYWDQWPAVLEYFRFRSGEIGLRGLFAQSNEHRIFFPRLVMFADLALFGGRNAFNVAAIDVFQVAHLLLIAWMGRAILARPFAGWVAAAFMAAAMLSGSQYENLYWGFQSQFVMVFLFASAALAAAASLPAAEPGAPTMAPPLAAAVLSAVVATFSMANGLLVWPLLLLTALQRRAGWPAAATVAVAGAASAAFYLHGYVPVATHTPVTAALHRPLDVAAYGFAYLGAVLAPRSPPAALLLGIALAALLGAVAVRGALRREALDRRSLFLWGVVLFVLLSAGMTALGRFGFGLVQALSPRYVTPGAVLWSAAALLVLDAFRGRAARAAGAAALALLTAWLALVDQPLAVERMADHERRMAVASDAVVAGAGDPAALSDLGTTGEAVKRLSALLKPRALSVFGSPEARWMGRKLDAAFTVVGDPSCLGSVDVVRAFGPDGVDGAAVAGWAWVGSEREGPAEVVLTDPDGTVVGFARGPLLRPDVPAANPAVPSALVGWRGFLSPGADADVLAYAVEHDGRDACPLNP